LRSASSSVPGRSAASRARAWTCSESRPNTASMTAWVPTSISIVNRTFGNAPAPLRFPERMNAAVLAALSAVSSMVPSQATSRSPNRNAPRVSAVARVPRTRANRAANGASPIRRRAWASPDDDGGWPATSSLCTSSRHTLR
jgi:hypothetical protein